MGGARFALDFVEVEVEVLRVVSGAVAAGFLTFNVPLGVGLACRTLEVASECSRKCKILTAGAMSAEAGEGSYYRAITTLVSSREIKEKREDIRDEPKPLEDLGGG